MNTFGTGLFDDRKIAKAVEKVFDLRVGAIIEKLDLKCPVFAQTSVGGHFGKEYFLWENTDKIWALLDALADGEQNYKQLSLDI